MYCRATCVLKLKLLLLLTCMREIIRARRYCLYGKPRKIQKQNVFVEEDKAVIAYKAHKHYHARDPCKAF